MPASEPNLKGFTAENWGKRWEIIERIVELARADRVAQSLPLEFKLNANEVARYLRKLQETGVDITEASAHSIVVFPDRIIAMDKNPNKEGSYEQRYLGNGKFGRVKLGKDKEGNAYALKVERKKSDQKSAQEQAIMEAIGVRIGGVSYQTNTTKPWLDEKPIHEKELTVMKLIRGTKLSAFLLRGAAPSFYSLDVRQRMLIAIGIIRAIDNLNNYGFAHRDTKADNFMLDITQLPPVKKLSADNVAAYLRGELPGYDFNNLIREIDWGLAIPISVEPQVFMRSESKQVYSIGYTAPEYYTSETYSRLSETYTVAKLLKNILAFDADILSKILPDELVLAVKHYEECSKQYNAHLRLIQNSIKETNGMIEPTVAKDLLEKEISLASFRDESKSTLAELLNIYPPNTRPSLLELSNDFEMRLINISRDLQSRSQFRIVKQSASASGEESSGYEEELESIDEFEESGYPDEMEDAIGHDLSRFTSSTSSTSSEESITASSSTTHSDEDAQGLDSSMRTRRTFTTSFSRSQTPEMFPHFALIENTEDRNEFLMANCILVEEEEVAKVLQTQSFEDLRELLSFVAEKESDKLMPIDPKIKSFILEKIEAEMVRQSPSSPSPARR